MDLNRTESEVPEIEDDSGTDNNESENLLAILKCSKCRFWCSDAKYVKLHEEIEHGAEPVAEFHPAVKKFKQNSSNRAENVEDIIKIAHTLMGQLYGLLLDSGSKMVENVAEKVPEVTDQAQQLIANLQSPELKVPETASRKRKRPSEEIQRIPEVQPTPEAPTESPLFDFQSLLQKRQTFGSANLLSNLASQSQQSDQIDRTQLLFDTIRAAQAAQQAQKMEDSEEEPDAVVNPQEPSNDTKQANSDDDEIEIIHTATDDLPNDEVKQEALAFPSSDTLSRSNSLAPFYSRNILTQIQKSQNSGQNSVGNSVTPKLGFESPKSAKLDMTSPYSLASFASLTQNGSQALSTLSSQAQAAASKTPISCSICGSHWRTPSALNIHMRVHTGEKPYKCYVCGKGHKQKGQLKVHMNKHHPGRWFGGQVYCKDPKKCSMCGEVYNDPKDLSKHILECAPNGVAPQLLGVNGPGTGGGGAKLTCEVCGAYFTSQATYKRHLDQHKEQQLAQLSGQLTPKPSPLETAGTPPETPRLSDFNSNQNSSVNTIAESLLARLKQNSALLQYKMAAQAQASAHLPGTTPAIDLKTLAANLIQNGVGQNRHISSDSLSNSSSNSVADSSTLKAPVEATQPSTENAPKLDLSSLGDKSQIIA